MSYTFFRFSITSPLKITSSFNSFTDSSLLLISAVSISGSLSHLLNALPPIDVDVLSSTHKSVPFFDLSLIFSVISRFLLAFISSDMYFEILYTVILLMWSSVVIWVCSIYSINAFIEHTAKFFSAIFAISFLLLSTKLNLYLIFSASSVKNLSLNLVIYESNLSVILSISSWQPDIILFITSSDGIYLAISSRTNGKFWSSFISAE